MEERIKKSFDFAVDLDKTLITITTGLLGFTVTFVKDILKGAPADSSKSLLYAAWILWLFSLLFGIWFHMSLTGTLASSKIKTEELRLFNFNIQLPSILQV